MTRAALHTNLNNDVNAFFIKTKLNIALWEIELAETRVKYNIGNVEANKERLTDLTKSKQALEEQLNEADKDFKDCSLKICTCKQFQEGDICTCPYYIPNKIEKK